MPLDNYLDAMGGIGNLVNPLNMINAGIDADQRQQFNAGTIAAQPGQLQAQSLSNQAQQQAMAANQAAQARQAQMVKDTQAAMANPTSASFAGLIAKYPEWAAAFKDSWQTRDKDAQQNDLTALGGIVSSINNGRPDLAMASVDARLAANKAAGKDQTAVQALSDALHAGNIDQAKGLASYMIAGAAGPEKLDDLVNAKKEKPLILKDGETAYDENGKVIAAQGEKPKVMTVKNADGSERIVQVNPGAAGGGISGQAPTPGFPAFYGSYLAKAEGGAAADGSKFGVDPKANPDVDTSTLTQTGAAKLLHDRYWIPSGADNIANPALQAIHADTAVNMGVDTARSMLAASGGDPAKYMQLRDTRYRSIAANNPDKAQYLPGWMNRNTNLANYAGIGSGGSSAPSVTTLSGGDADPTANLTGPDYLASLPPGRRELVQALVDGKAAVPARSKLGIGLEEDAARVDPSFDASNYPTRLATRKSFTSGDNAKSITALNTALRHAETLSPLIPQVSGIKFPLLGSTINAAANFYNRQSGDAGITNYTEVQGHLAEETAKAFRGSTGGNEADIRRNLQDLDPSNSTDQKNGALGKLGELYGGRIDELVRQYQTGMGPNKIPPGLSPKALAAYRQFTGQNSPADAGVAPAGGTRAPQSAAPASGNAPAGGAQAPQSAAPVQIATRAGVAALAPGTKFLWTDGNVHTRK